MGQKLLKLFLVYLIALVVMAVDFSPAFSGSNNLYYQQQAIRQQQEMLRQQQAAAQRARQAQEAARRAREQQVRQQQQLRQQQEAARRARQAQEAARRAQKQQQSRDQLAKQQQRQKQVQNQQIGQQKAQNNEARQKILKKQAERRLAKQADQRRKKQEAERKKAVTVQQLHAVRQLQQTRRVQTQRQVKVQDQKANQAKIDKERLNALKKKAANDNTRVNKGNVVKGNGGGPPSKPSLSKTFNREAQKKGAAAAKPVQLSKETRDKLASLPKKDPKVSGQPQGENKAAGKAISALQGARLKEHLRQVEKYGQSGVKELQNGRIRYYGDIKPASNSGEMAGRRLVREWDPQKGSVRTWHETVDRSGNVRIVRPQTGGPKVHYRFDESGKYMDSF